MTHTSLCAYNVVALFWNLGYWEAKGQTRFLWRKGRISILQFYCTKIPIDAAIATYVKLAWKETGKIRNLCLCHCLAFKDVVFWGLFLSSVEKKAV